MRKCYYCQREKTDDNFYTKKNRCKDCQKSYMTKYRSKERFETIKAYGGENPKCACPGCNENRLPFLCIDHVEGGGNIQRNALSTYESAKIHNNPGGGAFFRWLRNNNYPSGYQVLCHNCNMARSTGLCPVHQTDLFSNVENLIHKRNPEDHPKSQTSQNEPQPETHQPQPTEQHQSSQP